jgi:hypothetical protein
MTLCALVMLTAAATPTVANAQYYNENCDVMTDRPGKLLKKFDDKWPWFVTACRDRSSLAVWTIAEGDLVTVMYVNSTNEGVKIELLGAWFDPYDATYEEISKLTPEEFEALRQEARRHQQ